MKIKTIKDTDQKMFDKKVNAFTKVKDVKFTQTHIILTGDRLTYCAVCFYEGDSE